MSLAEELTDEAIDVVLMARRPLHPEMEKSFEDYMQWIEDHSDFWVNP
jgi:hypothetical protein